LPYRCGSAAALALADQIGRHVVTCELRAIDRYKRPVATCVAALNGHLTGAKMYASRLKD
jgi:hypothetical protein